MDVLIPQQGNGGRLQGHMIDAGDPAPIPGLEGGQGPDQVQGEDPGPDLTLVAVTPGLGHDLVVVLAPGLGQNLGQDLDQSPQ